MSSPVRVAIVGVGNCASALVQGVQKYANASADEFVPGLMHVNLGGYHVRDIQFVAAFDVEDRKVGHDLSEAIFAEPNNTIRFAETTKTGVTVERGPTLDGLGRYLKDEIEESDASPVDVASCLDASHTDVLVSYLPVGSQKASQAYAEACLATGVSFVNCIPVFIVSDPQWGERFRQAGIPAAGDDIKSQVGATILHRQLVRLFADRGVEIRRTYQLNTGGNTDFLNMLARERLASKKVSKTEAVTSQIPYDIGADNVHIGPSDYVPWQDDNKVCFLRIEGRGFGGAPIELEARLSVQDSPNSAGIVIDVIRYVAIARERGLAGPLLPISAYTMKHPPVQMRDVDAARQIESFLEKAAGDGAD